MSILAIELSIDYIELMELMDIRIEEITAKETYPLRHEVMWPNKPLEYVILKDDEEGKHWGLIVDQKLTSVISLFIQEEEAQFRKFATKESAQGKGLGTRLLKYVIEEVKKQHISRLWCNARIDKASFYEKFGLTKTEQTYTKGGIEYVIMERRF
ncbi:MAG: GNAT family N-acetyltransferase [Prolixibacteraceae bacterium]